MHTVVLFFCVFKCILLCFSPMCFLCSGLKKMNLYLCLLFICYPELKHRKMHYMHIFCIAIYFFELSNCTATQIVLQAAFLVILCSTMQRSKQCSLIWYLSAFGWALSSAEIQSCKGLQCILTQFWASGSAGRHSDITCAFWNVFFFLIPDNFFVYKWLCYR